jgi:hypothetical protein
MSALEPVGSLAIRVLPLFAGLVVHGVLIMGEGPLVAAEVVEEEVVEEGEVVLEDGGADVADARVGDAEDDI